MAFSSVRGEILLNFLSNISVFWFLEETELKVSDQNSSVWLTVILTFNFTRISRCRSDCVHGSEWLRRCTFAVQLNFVEMWFSFHSFDEVKNE